MWFRIKVKGTLYKIIHNLFPIFYLFIYNSIVTIGKIWFELKCLENTKRCQSDKLQGLQFFCNVGIAYFDWYGLNAYIK